MHLLYSITAWPLLVSDCLVRLLKLKAETAMCCGFDTVLTAVTRIYIVPRWLSASSRAGHVAVGLLFLHFYFGSSIMWWFVIEQISIGPSSSLSSALCTVSWFTSWGLLLLKARSVALDVLDPNVSWWFSLHEKRKVCASSVMRRIRETI